MKFKFLIILIAASKILYNSYAIGQVILEKDSIPRIFRMDMSDTLNIDTTNVVEVEYSQEAKVVKFEVKFKDFVKLNMFYDFQGMRNTVGFNPYDIVQDSVLNQSLLGY